MEGFLEELSFGLILEAQGVSGQVHRVRQDVEWGTDVQFMALGAMSQAGAACSESMQRK